VYAIEVGVFAMKNAVVYLIGYPGSGKLTIARALAAVRSCTVVDNHRVNHVILDLLDPDVRSTQPVGVWANVARVRSVVLDTVRDFAKAERSFVFMNHLLEGEEASLATYSEVAATARARGAKFLPVRLSITPRELARRVVSAERRESLKAIDPEAAEALASTAQVFVPPDPHLDLDVTWLSPERAAARILEELEKA
jgi:shikimate kinase